MLIDTLLVTGIISILILIIYSIRSITMNQLINGLIIGIGVMIVLQISCSVLRSDDDLKKNRVVTYYVYDSKTDDMFKERVKNILISSKWNEFHTYERTDDYMNSDISIKLVSDEDMEKYHKGKEKYYPSGKQIRFSVTTQDHNYKPEIMINANSWMYGVKESGLNLTDYRTYVINHEFGHGLGYGHQPCVKGDEVCPVMFQSTIGCPENIKCGHQPDMRDTQKRLKFAYIK